MIVQLTPPLLCRYPYAHAGDWGAHATAGARRKNRAVVGPDYLVRGFRHAGAVFTSPWTGEERIGLVASSAAGLCGAIASGW